MNFARVVHALTDNDVDFLIVGDWCAMLHGAEHAYNKVELFYSPTSGNPRRLVQALAAFHPRLRDLPDGLPFIWDEASLNSATILTLATDLGAIDLLAEVSGVGSFEEVKSQSIDVEAFGRVVRTLDLESLIKSKRAAGRQKDLEALDELESLREAHDPGDSGV